MRCNRKLRVFTVAMFAAAALVGCGGGKSGGSTPTRYRIGGTVSGLAGSGLVLHSVAAGDVTVTANGGFTFPTELDNGAAWTVSVTQQPTSPWQTCTIASGSGTINGANATVEVVCATHQHQVGGTVTGLAGSGLVLQNNGGDDITVTGDTFTFPARIASGASYGVTVKTQPSSPAQVCTVTNGTGAIDDADVATVAVACTTTNYALRGTVSGASVAGLVLHSDLGAGEDLAIPANATSFAFATLAPSGTQYNVTVKSQPGALTCGVANGSGVVGASDVTDIAVTCSAVTYTIAGSVSGLTATGLVLRNSAGSENLPVSAGATTFAFSTRSPSGTAWAVTVLSQPAGLECQVANGSGVLTGNVTNVAVTCARSYTIGGSVAGLSIPGLVLHDTLGNEDLSVPANATAFTFLTHARTGASYDVSVKTQPSANLTCSVSNGSGTVGTADVTSIAVSCTSALQAWSAPSTWGGYWQDSPTMVQHAHFGANGIVSDKGPAFSFVGGTAPTTVPVTGLGNGVTRYAGGPFTEEAKNYQATNAQALDLAGDLTVCAIVKPAKSRPYDSYESPIISKSVGDGKNTLAHAGWSLMQMHDHWCFHYEYKDANGVTHQFMSAVPAFFANEDFNKILSPPVSWPAGLGRTHPSFMVVCGGRNGNDVMISANTAVRGSYAIYSLTLDPMQTAPNPNPGPYVLDPSLAAPAVIGGYEKTSADYKLDYASLPEAFTGQHIYDGLIYETAVWNEPATAANLAAKMEAFLGVPRGATYNRNREGWFTDSTGKYRTSARHGPRIDPVKGYLFGLQSWNRLSAWMDGNLDYHYVMVFPAGEDMSLWTPTSGTGGAPAVEIDPNVLVPGDSRNPGQLVTLPAGASLSIDIDPTLDPAPGVPDPAPHTRRLTWDSSGPIEGQLWLQSTSAGTLRIQKTAPSAGSGTDCTVLGAAAKCEQKDVALTGLGGKWNRVSLNGAFTADATADLSGNETANKGKFVLTNPGSSAISFYVWGVQLTQLGGGGDLGSYDPAELMYDWNASRGRDGEPGDDPYYAIDVLKLPPPTASTAGTGFCLGVEATMPSGLPWAAPFKKARTAIAWVDNALAPTRTARIQVRGARGNDAGNLCFDMTGATSVCAPVPAGFDDGAKHVVKACVSPTGSARLYAGDSATPLASGNTGVAPPDISSGTLLVGNSDAVPADTLTPWNGYVSRVLVCRDTGNGADCR